jgi:hypothetical protein
MIPTSNEFFVGLVGHIAKFTSDDTEDGLALIHEGAAMTLDYIALQTIRDNPTGDHSDVVTMSECFLQHVEMFYKSPEELAAE